MISVLSWDRDKRKVDGEVRYSLGRRMTQFKSRKDVTPDLVTQSRGPLGIVAEAKRSMPAEERLWDEIVQQLADYDVDLEGWWTADERLAVQHDVVLLIHQAHGPKFMRWLRARESDRGAEVFRRGLCVVEFNVFTQVGERMHLCLRQGELREAVLSARLAGGVPVPMERVIGTYGSRKFYDSEPDPEYLMAVIWTNVVVPGRVGSVRQEGQPGIPVQVSVSSVTRELQKAFGARGGTKREVEYPKEAWVRRALNLFTDIDLASKVDDDAYRIWYREIRGDLIARFAQGREKSEKKRRIRGSRKGRSRDTRTLDLFGGTD